MTLTPAEIIILKLKGYSPKDIMKKALRHMGLSDVVKGKRQVTKEQAITIDQISSQIMVWF